MPFLELARILSRPKDFNTRSEDYCNRRTLLSFSTHDADRATKVEERRPGMWTNRCLATQDVFSNLSSSRTAVEIDVRNVVGGMNFSYDCFSDSDKFDLEGSRMRSLR
jgi:hypothetical protein